MANVEAKQAKPPWIPAQMPWPRRDGLFRFTVEQTYQLADLGFFVDRHVELIEGVLYELTMLPPLAIATQLVYLVIQAIFNHDYHARAQLPLDLGRRSLPEPEIAVVPGAIRDYIERHPTTSLLVVEVSDATLRKDRTLKAHLYASADLAPIPRVRAGSVTPRSRSSRQTDMRFRLRGRKLGSPWPISCRDVLHSTTRY